MNGLRTIRNFSSFLVALFLISLSAGLYAQKTALASGILSAPSITPAGTITTITGNGSHNFSGDNGPAAVATLNSPMGLAVDKAGNVYIADLLNYRVRKVAPDGTITTVAGNGSSRYSGDGGQATGAALGSPADVALDSAGNLYIADRDNSVIREVTADGKISTFAGTGTRGFSGDGGKGALAQLNYPTAITFDQDGNLYIADCNNNRIRKVTPAGTISSVAGNGTPGYSGNTKPAVSAQLHHPNGVAFGNSGNLYISDSDNNVIRQVDPMGTITTYAGGGTDSLGDYGPALVGKLYNPEGIHVDSTGNLFIADTNHGLIREVTKAGIILTVAGGNDYFVDYGPAIGTSLQWPASVTLDASGNLYISDSQNHRIRRVQATTIEINVGKSSASIPVTFTFPQSGTLGSIKVLTQGATGKDFTAAPGGCAPGSFTSNQSCTVNVVFSPQAPGVRNGAVLFYNAANPPAVIGKILLSGTGTSPEVVFGTGVISTIAGNGTQAAPTGDDPSKIGYAPGVALDGMGNLYFADSYINRVRKVAPNGTVTTFAGTGVANHGGDGGPASGASVSGPRGVAVDSAGNVYIADTQNNVVRKVALDLTISTIAGSYGSGYKGDGGSATSINTNLNGPTSLAFDSTGNLYIADSGNSVVRMVTPAGIIFTVAGNGTDDYSGDNGPAVGAELSQVNGLATDASGNLYIADTGNNRVRKVSLNGIITTVAGNGSAGYSGDAGKATSAALNAPYGVSVDAAGNLYIGDANNNRIRKVTPAGIITTVAGNGTGDYAGDNGSPTSAALKTPQGIAVDSLGNLYIADVGNYRIRKVNVSSPLSLSFVSAPVGSTSPVQNVSVQNLGNRALTISQISTAPDFTLSTVLSSACNSDGQTLASATTCTLGIRFTPQSPGIKSESLVLTDNNFNAIAAKQTISLNAVAPPFAATPVFSVGGGTYQKTQTVSITDSSTAVTIYYTLDGTIPSAASTRYTAPILASKTVTLNAIAIGSLFSPSRVATAKYVINPASATLALTAGNIAPILGQAVTLTATVTITNSTAAATGTYSILDGTKIVCSGLGNTMSGFSCQISTLALGAHSLTATYSGTVNGLKATSPAILVTVASQLAATPVFTPAAGTYGTGELITISESTATAKIHYTIDGTNPTINSTLYTTPIALNNTATIKAIAVASGYSNSGIATALYTIVPSPSVLTLPASAIATTSATLNARVNNFGGAGNIWFVYGVSSAALTSTTQKISLASVSEMTTKSSNLTGLTSKKKYYYQAVVSSVGGTSYGAVVSFTTN